MQIIHTSTTRKKKRKPTAAERQLAAEWEKIQNQQARPLEKGLQGKPAKTLLPASLMMRLENPPGRERTPKLPSRVTPGGEAVVGSKKEYTGSKMLGIGQLHKSNAVPVFRTEDAVDIAKMRRG